MRAFPWTLVGRFVKNLGKSEQVRHLKTLKPDFYFGKLKGKCVEPDFRNYLL